MKLLVPARLPLGIVLGNIFVLFLLNVSILSNRFLFSNTARYIPLDKKPFIYVLPQEGCRQRLKITDRASKIIIQTLLRVYNGAVKPLEKRHGSCSGALVLYM